MTLASESRETKNGLGLGNEIRRRKMGNGKFCIGQRRSV